MGSSVKYASCLLVGLAAGLVLAPHKAVQGVLASACNSPAHKNSHAPSPKHHGLPSSVTLTDSDTGFTAHVTNFRIDTSESDLNPGTEYLIIHVLIHSPGTNSQTSPVTGSDFTIHDDSSQVNYDGSGFVSAIPSGGLGTTDLTPGASVAGEVAFEVPTGQHRFSLQWQPSISMESVRLY